MTRRSGALIEGEHVSHAGNKRLKKAMFLPAFALLRSAPSPGPITGTNATRASAAPSRHRPEHPTPSTLSVMSQVPQQGRALGGHHRADVGRS
ncbi:MAG: hypothetical protein ACFNXT_08080 [Actinomyces massiliensis]